MQSYLGSRPQLEVPWVQWSLLEEQNEVVSDLVLWSAGGGHQGPQRLLPWQWWITGLAGEREPWGSTEIDLVAVVSVIDEYILLVRTLQKQRQHIRIICGWRDLGEGLCKILYWWERTFYCDFLLLWLSRMSGLRFGVLCKWLHLLLFLMHHFTAIIYLWTTNLVLSLYPVFPKLAGKSTIISDMIVVFACFMF